MSWTPEALGGGSCLEAKDFPSQITIVLLSASRFPTPFPPNKKPGGGQEGEGIRPQRVILSSFSSSA